MPNLEALRQLRRVVLAAPSDQFRMEVLHCGTVHCALGWTALDHWFASKYVEIMEAPLRLEMLQYADYEIIEPAARDVLGLTEAQTDRLFGGYLDRGDEPVSKDEVIWNIDRLIAGQEPLHYYAARGQVLGPYVPHKGPASAACEQSMVDA